MATSKAHTYALLAAMLRNYPQLDHKPPTSKNAQTQGVDFRAFLTCCNFTILSKNFNKYRNLYYIINQLNILLNYVNSFNKIVVLATKNAHVTWPQQLIFRSKLGQLLCNINYGTCRNV